VNTSFRKVKTKKHYRYLPNDPKETDNDLIPLALLRKGLIVISLK
jgi:hypothetical protein